MTACKYAGPAQPRVLGGRHDAACNDDQCPGCQPCTEPHCRVCHVAHHEGTCAECLAETREALRDIAKMCGALPEEVEHRGIEGEAMMLLGPVADPEAWGHVSASIAAGRLPATYVEEGVGEQHPATVLLTWEMVWRDALDHDESADGELATAVDYVDRTLAYMGGFPHVPFEDFARDLRRCRAHLEAVLHDGEQRDTGAPCMGCGVILEQPNQPERPCRHNTPAREWLRTLATYPELQVWNREEMAAKAGCGECDQGGRQDGWRCPRCRQTSTEDQYRFAVKYLHREEATHLTDREMQIRTGVKAGTVREWARRGHVAKRLDSGRTLYAVADVMARVQAAS